MEQKSNAGKLGDSDGLTVHEDQTSCKKKEYILKKGAV